MLLALTACGDSGVQVASDGSVVDAGGATAGTTSGGTTGGTSGGTTGTGGSTASEPLVEPEGDGPTGEQPETDSASRLDPADIEAARLLMQATFGPTPESIAELRGFTSQAAWIDAQLATPASLTEPYTRVNSNGSNPEARHEIWWNNALAGEDQLRQRVALALSQIFVISDIDSALANAQYGMANYFDMLAVNAFGTYRELLEQVTLHPTMGVFLSMVQNEKANPSENIRPDENYAREVLQLFSIGLYQLDDRGELVLDGNGRPIPTYSQSTIEEFARVFTGWDYPGSRFWGDTNITGDQFTSPMLANEAFHDTGSKLLLQGAVAPAGLSARQDLEAALDNIASHPNVGPFISKQLIQRLVTSDPSPDYVQRITAVFNNDGAGTRGNLGAVVRAILLDPVAREGHVTDPDFGKIREPMVRFAHFWRALDGVPGPESGGVHRTADYSLYRFDELTGQAVLSSPSVFNFYLPDNPIVPGGTRLSPEMQIMSEANLAATSNNFHHHVYRFNNRADLSDDNPRVTIIDLEPLADLASDPVDLLDWYNLVFYAGNMPDDVREIIDDYMDTLGSNDAGRFARAQDTLFLVLASPSFHIQR